MGTECTTGQMDGDMKACGATVNKMEKASIYFLMESQRSGCGKMERESGGLTRLTQAAAHMKTTRNETLLPI